MEKKTREQTTKIIQKAEKANEKSVYLEDLKDARKASSETKAKVAINNYTNWHKGKKK